MYGNGFNYFCKENKALLTSLSFVLKQALIVSYVFCRGTFLFHLSNDIKTAKVGFHHYRCVFLSFLCLKEHKKENRGRGGRVEKEKKYYD